MKHSTTLMLICVSMCGSACMQQDMLFPTMGDVKSMSVQQLRSHLEETERTIQEKDPNISADILESDKSLIAAYIAPKSAVQNSPTPKKHLPLDLDYGEIQVAWTAARTGRAAIANDQALAVSDLQRFFGRMGGLRISTEPEGASVELNSNPVGDTPYHAWREEGTYHVQIILSGYVTVEQDVVIIRKNTTIIEKKLQKR